MQKTDGVRSARYSDADALVRAEHVIAIDVIEDARKERIQACLPISDYAGRGRPHELSAVSYQL
jgi:hypothetical protein